MSIYIPGVKMPKEDGLVDLRIWGDGNMNRLHGYNSFVVPGVKAFEVPPHGRLIDQDAILREVIRGDYPNQWIDKDELLRLFRNAPAIIPESEVVDSEVVDNE